MVHCYENPIYVFQEKTLCGLSTNFHTRVSVSDLYIPRISPHTFLQQNRQIIVGIYNSLTETWMWKLGLRPRKSFSGNICFKFSVLCLCIAWARFFSEKGKEYFPIGMTCDIFEILKQSQSFSLDLKPTIIKHTLKNKLSEKKVA